MNEPQADKINKRTVKPMTVSREKEKKLRSLLEHYGIPRNDSRAWLRLSLCLAEEYVPNFNPRPKRFFWTPGLNRQLMREHERYKRKFPAKTDGEIFEYMITLSPWNKKNITARTLQNRLGLIKRKITARACGTDSV